MRKSFSGRTGQVWGLAISSDGRTLVSAGLDDARSCGMWPATGGSTGASLPAARSVPGTATTTRSPRCSCRAGAELLLTQSDGSLHFVDTSTLRSVRRVRVLEGFAAAAAYTPHGRTLAVAGERGQVSGSTPAACDL